MKRVRLKKASEERLQYMAELIERNDELYWFIVDKAADALGLQRKEEYQNVEVSQIFAVKDKLCDVVAAQEVKHGKNFEDEEICARLKRAAIEFEREKDPTKRLM